MHKLKFDGAITAVTQLQCGDVWIAAADNALLIVERKTADDLLASIADGRLFDQSAAMVAMSPWRYIVVQGTLTPALDGKTFADERLVNWQWAISNISEYYTINKIKWFFSRTIRIYFSKIFKVCINEIYNSRIRYK